MNIWETTVPLWCLFVLNSIYCCLSHLRKATGSLNVYSTCICVTDCQGINITQCLYKTNRDRDIFRNETPLWWCRLRHCTTGTYSPCHHSNQSFICSYWLSGDFTLELLISLKWRWKLGAFACKSYPCVYSMHSAAHKSVFFWLNLFVISCAHMWGCCIKGHLNSLPMDKFIIKDVFALFFEDSQNELTNKAMQYKKLQSYSLKHMLKMNCNL